MKALVLAAGFGKRLLPHTEYLPKPLFTIQNIPLIYITISKLIEAGCTAIDVNTHHLGNLVKEYLKNQNFCVPVNTISEDDILETGGAIRNSISDSKSDLLVVNGDIVFDFDLKQIIDEHQKKQNIVTLLMHDYTEFNNVEVDNNKVKNFRSKNSDSLAFTGIHIVSSKIKEHIPDNRFISIIDVYKDLILKGFDINFIKKDLYWKDIGTPENYKQAVIDSLFSGGIEYSEIKGDGSDRKWYRVSQRSEIRDQRSEDRGQRSEDRGLKAEVLVHKKEVRADDNERTYVISDHGINTDSNTREVESFVYIGTHLHSKGINVPEIYGYDHLSGIVSVEDLGSTHLADFVSMSNEDETLKIYTKVIEHLVQLSLDGIEDFDDKFCWQTKAYDEKLIIENECKYFLNEFVTGYCGIDNVNDTLSKEFKEIAHYALKDSLPGFMHRDFQSKNIMIKDNDPYFIDFQGGRVGPIEYDLASLLIDPYVNLPEKIKTDLLYIFYGFMRKGINVDEKSSLNRYKYCRISRNLQMLGAFSFLSIKKKKVGFEKFIPVALNNLKNHLIDCNSDLKILKSCVDESIGKLNIKV